MVRCSGVAEEPDSPGGYWAGEAGDGSTGGGADAADEGGDDAPFVGSGTNRLPPTSRAHSSVDAPCAIRRLRCCTAPCPPDIGYVTGATVSLMPAPTLFG